MQKWEYLRIHVVQNSEMQMSVVQVNNKLMGKKNKEGVFEGGILIDVFLADVGEQGWELVTQHGIEYIFKRPKAD